MKFWCYNDLGHDWGTNLYNAAHARGHDVAMFDNPRLPDNGLAFVHMHAHPEVRGLHKRAVETLATNADLTLAPSYRGSVLFDDKIEQLRQLAKYMPHTVLYQTPGRAMSHLESGKQPAYPFISKAREGTSGHNVRTIANHEQAMGEIKLAFSDRGIRLRHGLMQRSYLMWQRMIPNARFDIRVVRIGESRLVLKRWSHAKGGNSRIEPVVRVTDEIESALFYANAFFKSQQGLEWSAADLIWDDEKQRWFLLEVTCSWVLAGFAEAKFIRNSEVTESYGMDIWKVFVEEVEQGHFGEVK